ncbi:MAG: hypothetical protein CO186_04690 [Zetaproteobacteria bacterium CG_4_9_14_3_um_filter_49_83]|nr:MAG: hypothetical protein AUJ56_00645 [Zetaproteobacteria bacterium CG1_02_49_23]PIQ31505.1 MAG: hypothetical protein COW62_09575 [Zetaproteobacteria bacterium CG17_big_fil_post_rev_8_21_14_2_50_50_13]PIV29440.1 MAG: hypothetical protein COS35_12075 [Zetaproteobacteria bacterium CG02_land_8_20_14_3_00_50_9]PIY54616.1 MAG: hypothetical protein COZ00_13790 [Zetaproteobacteria bacterium CG_4_10_14_0_8_um_filter_49_80]PJA35654.1 MAG: hypothetical protein CO186_04690 [Zetaproteobacteria bacterium
MKFKSALSVLLFVFAITSSATASESGSHVHIAAVFKLPGQETFQWPEDIDGEDIMGALKGKADFLMLTQTVGIHNGDVLNVQNDVLRSGSGDALEDMGIDCQLSVNTSGKAWKVGGKCTVNLQNLKDNKVTGLILPHEIETEKVWHHVWDDPATGVAVYFFKETGAVL